MIEQCWRTRKAKVVTILGVRIPSWSDGLRSKYDKGIYREENGRRSGRGKPKWPGAPGWPIMINLQTHVNSWR